MYFDRQEKALKSYVEKHVKDGKEQILEDEPMKPDSSGGNYVPHHEASDDDEENRYEKSWRKSQRETSPTTRRSETGGHREHRRKEDQAIPNPNQTCPPTPSATAPRPRQRPTIDEGGMTINPEKN
jgi:hypothetical protein